MRKFCFACGKSTDELEGGRCRECSGKDVLVSLPKRIEVVACAKCEKMLFKNRWTDFNLERIVADAAKTSARISKIEAKAERKKLTADFVLEADSGKEKKETHEAVFHTNRVICSSCSRRFSGYYEAVLQLRGFSEGELERLSDVLGMIERKSFYRIKEVPGGFDIKIGNKLVVDSAAKEVRTKFPKVEMKKSAKIVTKIDGRDVHRKFILLRKVERRSNV